MEIIYDLFQSLYFYRVDNTNIYYARIMGAYGDQVPYISIRVPNHLAIQNRYKINEVRWKSLQTFLSSISLPLPKQRLYFSPMHPNAILIHSTNGVFCDGLELRGRKIRGCTTLLEALATYDCVCINLI